MKPTKEVINLTIPDDILKKLLTPSEMRMLKNRWRIIQLLQDGLTVRAASAQAGVGTDTVVRVSKMMGKQGFKKVSIKLNNKSSTSWIFGKGK